ncbi:hypothetical protein [Candidatus Methanodesulfokora washburnensis]|nr:hypothetical protein [Candidatus Methanodesulfokores washburnensis]
MKGEVVGISAEDEVSPALVFEIKIENPEDKRVLFTNIVSRVMTVPPMKQILHLGRLTPGEAFMRVEPKDSSTFTFYLDMDRKKLSHVEKARVDDVWLDIRMSTVFLELKDWAPEKIGWTDFPVTLGRYSNVRIPESDWLKLRAELGYGKERIVEVSEETYKLVEEYMRKVRARNFDDAIHEAVLSALHEEK